MLFRQWRTRCCGPAMACWPTFGALPVPEVAGYPEASAKRRKPNTYLVVRLPRALWFSDFASKAYCVAPSPLESMLAVGGLALTAVTHAIYGSGNAPYES